MNTEGDLECTCDVGPFATCPLCRAIFVDSWRQRPVTTPKRIRQNDDAALAQRIAEIKAGYVK